MCCDKNHIYSKDDYSKRLMHRLAMKEEFWECLMHANVQFWSLRQVVFAKLNRYFMMESGLNTKVKICLFDILIFCVINILHASQESMLSYQKFTLGIMEKAIMLLRYQNKVDDV